MQLEKSLAEELVLASRILYRHGVLDAWGHLSVRDPDDPDTFWMTRSMPPAHVETGDLVQLDLDGEPVRPVAAALFFERFIHGEAYRARPDVMAVLHSHSPEMIPYGVGSTPLRPVTQAAGFLGLGAPVFDIRDHDDSLDFLISDGRLGRAVATSLGDAAVVLLRGHGAVTVGPSLFHAVWRGIYGELNARQQRQALALGDVRYLSLDEAEYALDRIPGDRGRAWRLWVSEVAPDLPDPSVADRWT